MRVPLCYSELVRWWSLLSCRFDVACAFEVREFTITPPRKGETLFLFSSFHTHDPVSLICHLVRRRHPQTRRMLSSRCGLY